MVSSLANRAFRNVGWSIAAALAFVMPQSGETVYAEPSVIRTGFGAESAFDTASSSLIGRDIADSLSVDASHARPFTVPPDHDWYLHSVEVAVSPVSGPQVLMVTVLGDDARADRPGAPHNDHVLERFEVQVQPPETLTAQTGPDSIVTIPSAKGPVLRAGTQYWLAISVKKSDGNSLVRWWDAPPESGPSPAVAANRVNLGTWTVAYAAGPGQAFRINATPVPAPATPAYSFTTIAETSGPFRTFDHTARISVDNTGTVAFWAQLDNGTEGIFTGSGGTVSLRGDTGDEYAGMVTMTTHAALSPNGAVAWVGRLLSGVGGIFVDSGESLKLAADETGPFHSFGHPAMNSGGTMAFLAGLEGQGGGIFTMNAGSLVTIAHTGGQFNGFHDFPSINEKGTVAFAGTLDTGRAGIFTSRRGSITTIADTRGAFTSFGAPDLNDRGTVAFLGCMDPDRPLCPPDAAAMQGLFVGDGGPPTRITNTAGPYRALGNPTLNNAGTVAFVAVLDSGQSAIFTGPNPATDKVIAVGDSFMGSRIERVGSRLGIGLNDAGQIAFHARLADGREGIYVATPRAGS